MGRIHILSDQVANQIAAGEVVDRPASVVKELVENALDAGAGRIRIEIEGGGKGRIRVTDDGSGMSRDDALLALERHATSKVQAAEDLLGIRTLGFRGEALPSIASVARVELVTREGDAAAGTRIEIHGGRIARVEEAAAAPGTTLTVDDLFFNLPARRRFLKSEATETAHTAALATHYALAHPGKRFELHTGAGALLEAAPAASAEERVYQIFGRATLQALLPVASERPFDHAGLPEPPPWRREPGWRAPDPGRLRLHGFLSKPELQKASRSAIYLFANGRLIRDRLLLHAAQEAYRNILPPDSYPMLLLFLEMPPEEVDVNVHPSKTEVRFRQPTLVHDFVRDTLRTALGRERPAAAFLGALPPSPRARAALGEGDRADWVGDTPRPEYLEEAGAAGSLSEGADPPAGGAPEAARWDLQPPAAAPPAGRLPWGPEAAGPGPEIGPGQPAPPHAPPFGPETSQEAAPAAAALDGGSRPAARPGGAGGTLHALRSLQPLGQLRASFILAAGEDGLWIIDQHVAHERILFEKVLRARRARAAERQQLLMPLLVDLEPRQMAAFARIAAELGEHGFDAEPFGPRTLAVRSAPAGLAGRALERMLGELLDGAGSSCADEGPASPSPGSSSGSAEDGGLREDGEALRTRVAASIACHAAIKVNTPLDGERMRWLLAALGETEHPTSCPHGRPIALRYGWREIERAFGRT